MQTVREIPFFRPHDIWTTVKRLKTIKYLFGFGVVVFAYLLTYYFVYFIWRLNGIYSRLIDHSDLG